MINVEYMNTPTMPFEDGKTSTITMTTLDPFEKVQYDIFDEKDHARMLQDIERAIRNSFEYRSLIGYLRETEGMNTCSFLANVTNIDNPKVRIEIHHTPFSLYDIVSAVTKRRLHEQNLYDIFDIAKEVMWLHYSGWVGLIPVCDMVHELIHNSYIFVPTYIVRGNYKAFVNEYHEYIAPEAMQALLEAEEITQQYLDNPNDMNNIINKQMALFNQHATYINFSNLKPIIDSISQTQSNVRDRITDIKTNSKKQIYHLIKKVNTN